MSSHAPHKRQRCSHAVAAHPGVPGRTAVQRESAFVDHELDGGQNEDEDEIRGERAVQVVLAKANSFTRWDGVLLGEEEIAGEQDGDALAQESTL